MCKFYLTILISVGFFFTGCAAKSGNSRFKLDKDSLVQIELAKKLHEISGIAFDAKGRLFAHDDERAVIYQLDPQNGEIIKSFYLGLLVIEADFEDIAIVGNTFYLIASNGDLYTFKEGKNEERVEFTTIETGLHHRNNVEGLCYDPETDALLFALKGDPGNDLNEKKFRAVYSFSLKTGKLSPEPRFILDISEIEKHSKEKDFAPSGIVRDPVTGHFLVLASVGNVLVELDRKGNILSVEKLSKKHHYQPEGIDFQNAKNLYISDEGKKHGVLSRYKIR